MPDGKYKKREDVVVWTLLRLHERLAEKHHETFWCDCDTRYHNGREEFLITTIEHTKNPLIPQFDLLLDQGKITMDWMVKRPGVGGDTYSFKMHKKWRSFLFPESEQYVINNEL